MRWQRAISIDALLRNRSHTMHAQIIARFMGQHGAHLGPVGPGWAPCWPHEPCYQVVADSHIPWFFRPPGLWFNIKMSSYQYRKSHCGDKTVVRSSYLHNVISYSGKMASLYWISPLQDILARVFYEEGFQRHLSSRYRDVIWKCEHNSARLWLT